MLKSIVWVVLAALLAVIIDHPHRTCVLKSIVWVVLAALLAVIYNL